MKQLDKLHKQMANLVDMCADGDISREVFRSKKKKLEDQISNIEKINSPGEWHYGGGSAAGAEHVRSESSLYFLKECISLLN